MKETNFRIVGTGRYIPEATITNRDLEQMVATSNDWIIDHTGISTRHKAVGEDTSDLATKAALNALDKAKLEKELIDMIIVATFTPDMKVPSTASLVQSKLGLNHRDITCFDINAACTGFIYALQAAAAYVQSGMARYALVIGAEVITKMIDYTDRNTCILFGDGAGALIIGEGNKHQRALFYTASEGDTEEALIVKDHVAMNGRKVYRFAIEAIKKSIYKLLTYYHIGMADLTKIFPHQANYRIIESVASSLEVPLDLFHMNIEKYGNTSAASIPIGLDEYFDMHPRVEGQKILLVGFGGGLTWGSTLINI